MIPLLVAGDLRVRVAPSHGLMDGVAFPCCVDPGDPHRIWIDWVDWDAA
jgi:hypothetical protein